MVKLGYEQLMALRMLFLEPDTEGSVVCKTTQCSFSELFDMANQRLIEPGFDRIVEKQVHPVITQKGFGVILEASSKGWIDPIERGIGV